MSKSVTPPCFIGPCLPRSHPCRALRRAPDAVIHIPAKGFCTKLRFVGPGPFTPSHDQLHHRMRGYGEHREIRLSTTISLAPTTIAPERPRWEWSARCRPHPLRATRLRDGGCRSPRAPWPDDFARAPPHVVLKRVGPTKVCVTMPLLLTGVACPAAPSESGRQLTPKARAATPFSVHRASCSDSEDTPRASRSEPLSIRS